MISCVISSKMLNDSPQDLKKCSYKAIYTNKNTSYLITSGTIEELRMLNVARPLEGTAGNMKQPGQQVKIKVPR